MHEEIRKRQGTQSKMEERKLRGGDQMSIIEIYKEIKNSGKIR